MSARLREKPPLSVLRKQDGRPNYRDGLEAERYLAEAGWLAWSTGGRRPDDWPSDRAWPEPWESWLSRVEPGRVPPTVRLAAASAGADPERIRRGQGAGGGRPSVLAPEQIDAALARLADGETITGLAKGNWQQWGFKSQKSAESALRRWRSVKSQQGVAA